MPGNEPSTEGTGGSPALGVGGGPPAAKPSLLHPKAAATSRMGDLWKVPWSPRLLVVGIPIPASFLGVNPTTDDITLCRVELQELACVRETKVKGEEIKRHNRLWLFVTSAPLLLKWTIQEQGFPPGSGYLSNQSWAGRNAAALWPFLRTTTLKQWAFLVAQRLKRLPAMQETRVRSLSREDPLAKEMATHSSILAWRIPWREEPGRLQSTRSQRVRHDWATSLTHSLTHSLISIFTRHAGLKRTKALK